jgi:outer membrane protein OmpA-like peptidoglycan-associated protein
MSVKMFALELEEELAIPDVRDVPLEQQGALCDALLGRALERAIEFEPNKSAIAPSGMSTIRAIARVLGAFEKPFVIKCVGHAKGRPSENNEAKKKLSCARAESVRAAVIHEGAKNEIFCVGEGSAKGAGMCVTMCVADEMPNTDIQIPNLSGLDDYDTQVMVLNQVLALALDETIEFEPNGYEVPLSAMGVIRNVARLLNAAPEFAVKCDGHSKGNAADNTAAKKKLSKLRAEAIKSALVSAGVRNRIVCSGQGSAQGQGMRVTMYVADP